MVVLTRVKQGRCTYCCTYHSPRGRRFSVSRIFTSRRVHSSSREYSAPTTTYVTNSEKHFVLSNRRFSTWDLVGDRRGRQVNTNQSTSTTIGHGKLLYRVSEAAQLLSCSKSALYEEIKAGRIQVVYPRTRMRILATAIFDYLQLIEREARYLDGRPRNFR